MSACFSIFIAEKKHFLHNESFAVLGSAGGITPHSNIAHVIETFACL